MLAENLRERRGTLFIAGVEDFACREIESSGSGYLVSRERDPRSCRLELGSGYETLGYLLQSTGGADRSADDEPSSGVVGDFPANS